MSKGDQGIHFIVGHYYPQYGSLKASIYAIQNRGAIEYAQKINKELAEGPTEYIPDNEYGPVELWPLVYLGGEE